MRIRCKMVWQRGSWRVDLPTYEIVEGSVLPVTPGLTSPDGVLYADPVSGAPILPTTPGLEGLTVEVECPDDYAARRGGPISADAIRAKYAGHPRFGQSDYTPDI